MTRACLGPGRVSENFIEVVDDVAGEMIDDPSFAPDRIGAGPASASRAGRDY